MEEEKDLKPCELCKTNKSECSAVLNGVYYKHVCGSCKLSNNVVSSGHANWNRTIDIEDNEAAVQQPWNADGTINTRFAKLYPTQAKALFTPEQIRNANR